MDMYRRNTFRAWFEDIGFLYLLVVAFVALVFLLKDIRHVAHFDPTPPAPVRASQVPPP